MEECYDHESEEDFSAKTPENIGASPLSGDEEAYHPSPRRSGRRGARKRVVTVPFTGGGDGYRSRGEVYPPPDSWSWRKYGQKPIKGSPYPRGYYRCSSLKGCPARKQVERSRHDPTTILITYCLDHNHTHPASKNHRHNSPAKTEAASGATTSTSPSSSTATTPANFIPEESTAANSSTQLDVELSDDGYYSKLAGELGWLCEMGSTMMDGTTLVGPVYAGHPEMEAFMPIGEEDEILFGDLGDLPEYSMVFGRVDTAGHVAVAQDNFL